MAWLSRVEKRMSSACIALRTADDRVLVVKANYKKYWTFPGGTVNKVETPMNTAVRGVKEEVGLDIDSTKLGFCLVVDRASDLAQTYEFLFEAQVDAAIFAGVKLEAKDMEGYDVISRDQIINGDRNYSKSVREWALGTRGYLEQKFPLDGKDNES